MIVVCGVFYSVQKAAIPSLLEGRDVFVKSKTGTGTCASIKMCIQLFQLTLSVQRRKLKDKTESVGFL